MTYEVVIGQAVKNLTLMIRTVCWPVSGDRCMLRDRRAW